MLGGHSIDVLEPLFGLVVIGEVHPDRALTNAGACAGDVLVLTKPLGTGILSTALKRDALLEAGMAEAVRSMTTLNEGAARAALAGRRQRGHRRHRVRPARPSGQHAARRARWARRSRSNRCRSCRMR